ncbi:MAG: CHRD domain-containing protein [Candidatus Eisenbacteria bacterium]
MRDIGPDFTNLTADGVWKPTDAAAFSPVQMGNLVSGLLYENVHTVNNPGGEIRGQIGTRQPTDVPPPSLGGPRLELANWPNPFAASTHVRFYLPREGAVSLKLYDASGRELRTLLSGPRPAGWGEISVDGRNLPNGLYLYRLDQGGVVETRKMLHLN